MRRRALGLALLLLVAAPGAAAYPRPGQTERVSVAFHGGDPNGESYSRISVSADGRYVAFGSYASNLITDEPLDFVYGVYVRDQVTGTTELIAKPATDPSISPDGRHVAFRTAAALVPEDTNGVQDVYVRDRTGGAMIRASVGTSGQQPNGTSSDPSMSNAGVVAFASTATNLGATPPPNSSHIYVRDIGAQTTRLVSGPLPLRAADGSSYGPSISADGSRVAFISWTSTLVGTDENGRADAFVRDLVEGSTQLVSVTDEGTQANEASYSVAISGDGNFVVFETHATNLVPQDTNGFQEIYIRDLTQDRTERVSVSASGEEGNHASIFPSISHDGRYVSFQGGATNLVPNDTNGQRVDIFVRDRLSAHTELVSTRPDGNSSSFISFWSAISPDGRHVAFANRGNDLVAGDTSDQWFDMYARDRGPATGVGDLAATAADEAIGVSGWATFAGQTVATASEGVEASGLAESLGGDLTAARLTVRPEAEDIHIGIDVSRLPSFRRGQPGEIGATSIAGLPGVVYSASFLSGGVPFEVRALRAGLTAQPSALPLFALYRCDETPCREVERLRGSIGTTGHRIEVSLPLAALGDPELLEAVTIRTAVGEAAPGGVVPLDDIVVGDAPVPKPSVALALTPSGTPEDQVEYSIAAQPAAGRFAASIPAEPGSYELWARACLGSACGARSVPVTVG